MKSNFIMFLGVMLLFGMGCQSTQKAKFELGKGLNASHWLSQSEKRGEERQNYMTESDFKRIADLGFDHVRLPIDEMQMWDENGNKLPEAFTLMHNAINWSLKHGLRVIIDLHVLRSHHFNDTSGPRLWTDKNAQQDFIKFWQQLSAELQKYPLDKVAYEPLNEAIADKADDWNNLINWVIAEIRKLEPERTIIMGSNRWQQVGTFKDLRVPENDKNIILSFHYYEPFALTHYKTWWTPIHDYSGPINYPGLSIDTTAAAGLAPEMLKVVRNFTRYADKTSIEKEIMQAVQVARKHNLQLYCGEWGAYPSTPMALRQAWYRDMVDIFKKHDIAWAHWNYKNDFPIVDENLQPISELLDIMVGQ